MPLHFQTLFFLLVASLIQTGCTTIVATSDKDAVTHHYLGYARMILPRQTSKSVFSTSMTAIGVYSSNGVGVGYVRDENLVVPLDCRVVVFVDKDNWDATLSRFEDMIRKGEKACMVEK
jgi:hypothetical protein